MDAYGKSWYMGVDGAGKSVYTYTQNGVVKGVGYDHVVEPHVVAPARQEFNRGFNSWLRGVYASMGVPSF